jgi:hypothetical protein
MRIREYRQAFTCSKSVAVSIGNTLSLIVHNLVDAVNVIAIQVI